MIAYRTGIVPCVLLAMCVIAAQGQTKDSENGALSIYGNGGWSFGLPGVYACVNTTCSPEKKTLPTLGFGVGVKAWRYLEPFMDFAVIDTGKAYAEQGSLRSEVKSSTFNWHGGLRVVGGNSRIRPYAHFGAGRFHQSVSGNFSFGNERAAGQASGSMGSLLYGGGVKMFLGKRWGTTMGLDAYRLMGDVLTGGKNFSRVHFGMFFQSKSSIE
jgi:hypothetical protein